MNPEVKAILVTELNNLSKPSYVWTPRPAPDRKALQYAFSGGFTIGDQHYATGITPDGEDWLFRVEHPVKAWFKSQLWETPMIPTVISIIALGVSVVALAFR